MFCELGCAASILGTGKDTVAGWLDGGYLRGTFTKDRWLADSADVLRLHVELVHREGFGVGVGGCGRPHRRPCAEIARLNARMLSDMSVCKLRKNAEKLVEYVEEISIIATPGLRPPPPKKRSKEDIRRSRERVEAKIKANQKKREQRRNSSNYESFLKGIGKNFMPPSLPIGDKRFWWNEE